MPRSHLAAANVRELFGMQPDAQTKTGRGLEHPLALRSGEGNVLAPRVDGIDQAIPNERRQPLPHNDLDVLIGRGPQTPAVAHARPGSSSTPSPENSLRAIFRREACGPRTSSVSP